MRSRIEKIIKEYNLSSSIFADEIKVQRAQISHILSGRNNPSLDIAQKILLRFPGINSEWLILGTGKMLKSSHNTLEFENFSDTEPENEVKNVQKTNKATVNIDKILVFYSDNTFEEYFPNR